MSGAVGENGQPSTAIRRIVVALDASQSSLAALETAAELAAALRAELRGLFVEDENLVRLAGHPLAREFDRISARPRTLQQQELRRHLARQAQQVERALSEQAEIRKVVWSFRTVRGHVTREVRAAASQADLLVVGSRGRSPGSAVGSTARALLRELPTLLLVTPARGRGLGPVFVIYDGSEIAERALRLASDIATSRSLPIRVLIVPDGEVSGLRDRAVSVLGERAGQAAYDKLDPHHLRGAPALLRARGCGLLVTSRGAIQALGDQAAEWIASLHCPLLVVQ